MIRAAARALPCLVAAVLAGCEREGAPADAWDVAAWAPAERPARGGRPVLAITDLPALDPFPPTPEAFAAARELATDAGATGAVLTFGWSALEAEPGRYTLDELRGAVEANAGREAFLGLQLLDMANRELPADLAEAALDDPALLARLRALLDVLAPLLRGPVRTLSLGNEVDWYLGLHPDERPAFRRLLEDAWAHARTLAPDLALGTTLTAAGTEAEGYAALVAGADVHVVTYYHGTAGEALGVRPPEEAHAALLALVDRLDDRPVVFQELGYPASPVLGSSSDAQAAFVREALRAWSDRRERVPFVNWFQLVDFPQSFCELQVGALGLEAERERFVAFLSSLGLFTIDGGARPGWDALREGWREF